MSEGPYRMLWHICRHYIEEKKACLPALHQMSFWLSSMPFIAIKEQCWAIAIMAIYFPLVSHLWEYKGCTSWNNPLQPFPWVLVAAALHGLWPQHHGTHTHIRNPCRHGTLQLHMFWNMNIHNGIVMTGHAHQLWNSLKPVVAMAQPQQGTRLPPTVASKVNEVMDSQKPINTQVDQIIQVFPRIQASRKVPISKSATSSQYTASTSYQRNFRNHSSNLSHFWQCILNMCIFGGITPKQFMAIPCHCPNMPFIGNYLQAILAIPFQVGHGPFFGTAWQQRQRQFYGSS